MNWLSLVRLKVMFELPRTVNPVAIVIAVALFSAKNDPPVTLSVVVPPLGLAKVMLPLALKLTSPPLLCKLTIVLLPPGRLSVILPLLFGAI